MAFSPDGKYLAVVGEGVLTIMDATNGAELLKKEDTDLEGTCSVAFSPDGKYLAVTSESSDVVKLMSIV
ncbi:MAG TPA: WD40 repeat domain-containing protein [Candidatus Nanopusillus sp.]|nr:WD40 repeat domain-containing protein [Candidatus Nanopusillus sp.]